MSAIEELNNILHKDEIAKDNEEKQKIDKLQKEYVDALEKKKIEADFPLKKIAYKLALVKKIICHCMGDLYIESLIIDNPEKYSDSLRNAMTTQCMEVMKDSKTIDELKANTKDASPYIKGMVALGESIADTKTDEEIKSIDNIDNIVLSNDDIELIDEFEKIEGKDCYASDIQDRVVDVYKAEQKLGEERNEKVQNIVDDLAAINEKQDKAITEAIESGFGLFNKTPKTIFNAIFINKSKNILNENGEGTTISDNTETIIAETICTYTLLECIHSLGLKTFTTEEKINLKNEFYAG